MCVCVCVWEFDASPQPSYHLVLYEILCFASTACLHRGASYTSQRLRCFGESGVAVQRMAGLADDSAEVF